MNEAQILDMWFKMIPDARRDEGGDETDARLYVCGMLVTQLRVRAHGQHSVDRLFRCQVLVNDMQQVAQHLANKARMNDPRARAASKGLYIPGSFDDA